MGTDEGAKLLWERKDIRWPLKFTIKKMYGMLNSPAIPIGK
jgi:hypothetical protein